MCYCKDVHTVTYFECSGCWASRVNATLMCYYESVLLYKLLVSVRLETDSKLFLQLIKILTLSSKNSVSYIYGLSVRSLLQ